MRRIYYISEILLVTNFKPFLNNFLMQAVDFCLTYTVKNTFYICYIKHLLSC